jgi:hypothetical protein
MRSSIRKAEALVFQAFGLMPDLSRGARTTPCDLGLLALPRSPAATVPRATPTAILANPCPHDIDGLARVIGPEYAIVGDTGVAYAIVHSLVRNPPAPSLDAQCHHEPQVHPGERDFGERTRAAAYGDDRVGLRHDAVAQVAEAGGQDEIRVRARITRIEAR